MHGRKTPPVNSPAGGSILKKIKIFAPLLALPLLLLGGCKNATPAIGLSANWNRDTAIGNLTGEKPEFEELVYGVTFESKETEKYAVHYENGTYTTRLGARLIEVGKDEAGNPVNEFCYYYRTSLDIDVYFTIGEQKSETFRDTLVSEVWFRNLDNALQPVKSVKTGVSHTPVGNNPKSLEDDYYAFFDEYNCTIEYNNPLTSAAINRSYQERYSSQTETTEKKTELTTKLKADNFFDNEQIMFMLRGTDMSESVTLKTLNSTAFASMSTVRAAAPKATSYAVDFAMIENGETKQVNGSIDAFSLEFSYSSGMSGQAQQAVYAARTNVNDNLYRNVLLYMEVPLFSSLGTLKYTLKTATFL